MHILTSAISVIQLWWTVAYLVAYTRIKQPLLLVQVVQGVAFGLLFVFLTIAIMTQQQIGGIFSGILLLIGLVMGFIWRRRDGINLLIEHYPRAMIDVLLFRQPGK